MKRRTPAVPGKKQKALDDEAARQHSHDSWEKRLLLMQVKQLQEELEHYFREYHHAAAQMHELQGRYQKLVEAERQASGDSLQLLLQDGAVCQWRLQDFTSGDRRIPVLRFATLLDEGLLAFMFEREGAGRLPLLRWPFTCRTQQSCLLPAAQAAGFREGLSHLLALGTTDWTLVSDMAQRLADGLADAGSIPGLQDSGALLEGAANLTRLLRNFPATLRHDRVKLQREQVNPDYEHLWLRLEKVSLGDEVWTAFEFRLSCAHVRPGVFGRYPKLEFPERLGSTPFDSWFVESHDDFGSKLELRFELPDTMDLSVWQKLSARDQGFVRALLQKLPLLLMECEYAGMKTRRPLSEWRAMVAAMLQQFRECQP